MKIRLQLQVEGQKYKGILSTMRTIVAEESVFALWKGNVPASVMYVLYGATQFTTYSTCNNWLSRYEREHKVKLGPGAHAFILGSVAGGCSTVVSYPFDLLRTRFANSAHFLSVYTTVADIIRHEGPLALFRGVNTGIASISLYSGILFWSYESAKIITRSIDKYPSLMEPVSGFTAGVVAKAIVFPLDLLRKRLQVHSAQPSRVFTVISQILKFEGPRGFYKGFFVSIVKNAPTTALSLWTFEYVMRLMD